jgi:hypothetical protein
MQMAGQWYTTSGLVKITGFARNTIYRKMVSMGVPREETPPKFPGRLPGSRYFLTAEQLAALGTKEKEEAKVSAQSQKFVEKSAKPHTPTKVSSYLDSRYYSEVDEKNQRVICFLPWLKSAFTISFEEDRILHSAYSRDGANLTIKELAQKLGWPPKITAGILRARSLTHASEPLPSWEIAAMDDDEVLESLEAQRLHRLRVEADRRHVQDLKKDWKDRQAFSTWLREFMFDCPPSGDAVVQKCAPRALATRYHVVDAMTDVHVEALGVDGRGWRQTADLVREHTKAVVTAALRCGDVSRVVLMLGSDWFDADNMRGTTTNGTQMTASMPRHQVPAHGWRLFRERVEAWRRVAAEVVIAIIPGNHDHYVSWFMAELCRTAYADAKDVTISEPLHDSGRVYLRLGATLVGLCHGHTMKAKDLPAAMLAEAPHDLIHGSRRRIWVKGHTHVYDSTAVVGTEVTTAPALTPSSQWAVTNFGGSDRATLAMFLSEDASELFRFEVRG